MTKKQEQAIRTLYNDGITYTELNKGQIPQDKQKYLINGKIYTSKAIGTFNEHGSFLCCGPYAVIIKGREAYDKFFEIKSSDLRYHKENKNINSIFCNVIQLWNDYLNGKYIKTSKEGDLAKDWKNHLIPLSNKDPTKKVYKINNTMLNKIYLDHALKFLKPKVHWIIVKNELSPVILTDDINFAFICPIKQRED